MSALATNNWLRYPPRTTRENQCNRGEHRRLRAEWLARFPTCQVCGESPATELDHRTAVCLGGTDHPSNYQTICAPCHRSKSGREANFMRWNVYRHANDERGCDHAA